MANSKQKNLLVTTALPYGNGSLHIGHLLEHTQTDIWVRTNKMEGNNVLNFCAKNKSLVNQNDNNLFNF